MQMLYLPFKIIYMNDSIAGIQFKETDSLWSRNFKRAIATIFQLKHLKDGAYVENEANNILLFKINSIFDKFAISIILMILF